MALGLPLVVTTGWSLGDAAAPPPATAPSGSGGIGAAPVSGAPVGPTGAVWSPRAPAPVAVRTRVPMRPPHTGPAARPAPTRDRPPATAPVNSTGVPTEATIGPTELPTEVPSSVEPPPVP